MEAKYTPDGVRIYKKRKWGTSEYNHKYIVDMVGELPVILLVLDADDDNAILKSYIHANNQIIMQHNGDYTGSKYFYLHDRLGSVRQVIDSDGSVVNCYTYNPWGVTVGSETSETFANPYRFAGYLWDDEAKQYYCNARQYDPVLGRFTSRDPVFGRFQEPLTLHKYLYCINNPLNMVDPTGLWALYLTGTAMGSFGGSGVRQGGIVIDDDGNVGWINITGIGAGSPAATLGGSIGWTNADTIFDIQGAGLSLGGSIVWGGGEYIVGKQRSGELYHGVEFTFGLVTAPVPAEIHGQATHTTVYESDINWEEASEKIKEGLLESAFGAETLGEAHGLLFIWGLLE